MIVPGAGFSGYVAVQIPENAVKIYTDEAVRQMFASAVTRKQVSADEQIALMPFKITDLADFKDVRTLAPGSSIILADGDESSGYESKPFMILGVIGATPQPPTTAPASPRRLRSRFPACASRASPCPSRSASTASRVSRPGSTAISGKDKTPVTVVQWIRFSSGALAAHHRQRPARRSGRPPSPASARSATASSRRASHDIRFAGTTRYRGQQPDASPKPAAFSGFCSYTNGTRLPSVEFILEGGE